MSKPKILIVDDEKPLRDTLAKWLKPNYDCLTAPSVDEAMKIVEQTPELALIVTDVKMPGETGVDLLRRAKSVNKELPIVLLTAYGTVDLAVEAMQHGADDFVQKPVTNLNAFEKRLAKCIKTSEASETSTGALESFTGKSPSMEAVYGLIRKVAPTAATVLIEGPSGTGKELVARALHNLSPRKDKPFVAVECSAFSDELLKSELFGYEPGTFTGGLKEGKAGCFEQADGGTLFLDEIGEIDTSTQIALLRVLETKSVRRLGGNHEQKVDFRLVAATNKDLAQLAREGKFREDLYYRLKVIDIKTPALKDHKDDIPLLVARFIKEYTSIYSRTIDGISSAALKALEDYTWPGNVRELRNVIEKMVVLASETKLTERDLPDEITRPASTRPSPQTTTEASSNLPQATSLADSEKNLILSALEQAEWNKTKAAEALGISRRTLHRKLNDWGIDG